MDGKKLIKLLMILCGVISLIGVWNNSIAVSIFGAFFCGEAFGMLRTCRIIDKVNKENDDA
jgi:uncharacterized membrane protein